MGKTPQERYQEKPFYGSSHSWARKELAAVTPNIRVLDVGPGSGVMGRYLKEKGLSDLYAVEIDDDARKHVAPIYKEVKEIIDDLNCTNFDLILLLDVLEHMTDPFAFYHDIFNYLKPGGKVLVSLPNVAHWSVRLPLLFGVFNYSERGILDKTHFQFFTRKRFKKLLLSHPEARIVSTSASIEPVEFLLPNSVWNNPIFLAISTLRLRLAQLLPGFFAYQHLAVVERCGSKSKQGGD
ncbi:MAG: class I SAM-dependent methyltransferase [Candidatus Dadabacteria bacterium]|nr:MAG: class I SAM-dependent methyltransferase [Candidatus Dadabacteria bacterium]